MTALRQALERTFVAALARVDLRERVREALEGEGRISPASVRVVAVGKAAPTMLEGALAAWGGGVARALVITPEGTPSAIADPRVTVLRAAHPVPDERSVEAGERALAFVKGDHARTLVLVSGGASSLLCAPDGVTLDAKAAIVRALLARGAPIQAMNLVRRHLSRVKGGGLTRASSVPVLALVASDVLAGAPFDIGSGPTVPDPTTREEARAVLARFAPDLPLPSFIETLKPHDPEAQHQRARIVASPEDLADALAGELRALGAKVTVLAPSGADVEDLAAEYLRLAGTLAPGAALVRAAEPTVVVRSPASGKGGRSGHLAALVARGLPPGLTFLAAASDGVDGSSGAAGAIVDASLRAHVGDARLRDAIARFDTASIHDAAGTALRLGPTGHNLADVHALVRL